MKNHLIVRLKGGLGNQMFQYAAGRALAIRNDMPLMLDTHSGFVRDKQFQRTFSLDHFPIRAETAGFIWRQRFWLEQFKHKFFSNGLSSINHHAWGTYLYEADLAALDEVIGYRCTGNTWMEGHWQSESYFADYADFIERELTLPNASEPQFTAMANTIEQCESIALGVRVFEEVPGQEKTGVGGITPLSFYEEAAEYVSSKVKDPAFFIFCTTLSAVQNKFKLPGKVHFITHDNGFDGTIQRLWLISRCRHHIVSNSSFYWWGAWFGERRSANSIIVACDLFTNQHSIPSRWQTHAIGR